MCSILKVENIHKTYVNGSNKLEALKGISFQVKENEIVAIMGSSGSGKSTMLNILGALDNATEGHVFLNGQLENEYGMEPRATTIRKENIGFVFQNYNLINDLNVYDNIALPLILENVKKSEINNRVEQILEMVGIKEKKSSAVTDLSGGQQQRVAIARALIANPKILLADEPTGNLDYNSSQEILKLFLQMRDELQQSIVIVTHDPTVASFADRIIFFHDGQIKREYKNSKKKEDLENIISIFANSLGN